MIVTDPREYPEHRACENFEGRILPRRHTSQ